MAKYLYYRRGAGTTAAAHNPVTGHQWVKRNTETGQFMTLRRTVSLSKVFVRKTRLSGLVYMASGERTTRISHSLMGNNLDMHDCCPDGT